MKTKTKIVTLLATGLTGILVVIILFFLSEKQMHRNNAFVRRYPHHPIQIKDTINLRHNSYYFAGIENDTLYLGNTTAPLYVMKVSLKTKDTSHFNLQIPDFEKYQFRRLRLQIMNSRFYLYDGSIPAIFTAPLYTSSTNKLKEKIYFDHLQVIDSSSFWIRSELVKSKELELGILKLNQNNSKISFYTDLLTKNVDGFFDVDGTITLSKNKLLYVYFYRNQYLVMNNRGSKISTGKTIDTIRQAKIEIVTNKKQNLKKLASPPTIVNLYATAWDNFLYIQSNRLGKYEPDEMLEKASIIDVYNYTNNSYEFSFYLYDIFDTKAREFIVEGPSLFALHDKFLIMQEITHKDKEIFVYPGIIP